MRRRFIRQMAVLLGGAGLSINSIPAAAEAAEKPRQVLRFGIMADLHHDLIKDGAQRLESFIDEMNRQKPDFIIQMGDFCFPKPVNRPLMDTWNRFEGPKYHVIGNHDNDGGFTHEQVIEFWNAKGKYYSFDVNGYRCIVLNGNERPPGDNSKGYPRSVLRAQCDWLEKEIDTTGNPVLIFCHQGIDNDSDGVKEGIYLRLLFENANKKAGWQKVRAVFSGHHHEDYMNTYNNIHYVQINSMSYQFNHLKDGYSFNQPKDALYALVSLDSKGTMHIKGRQSEHMTQLSAAELEDWKGYATTPVISDRVIKMG
ncbi:metallophosphoesterase family protein [Chitinophaga barathri]|nr:metallophosphoesterase [Chitinophaga barathri]